MAYSRTRHPILLFSLMLSSLAAPARAAESLEEAVRHALDAHPALQSAMAQRDAAKEAVIEAKAGYLPVLNVSGGGGVVRSDKAATRDAGVHDDFLPSHTAGISGRQLLFDHFATGYRTDAASERADAAERRIEEARNQVSFQAVHAYLGVLRGREFVRLADENLKRHRTLLADITSLQLRGGGSVADVALARARAALAEATLDEQIGLLRNAEVRFREIVGHEPLDLVALPGLAPPPGLPPTIEEAVARGVGGNPAIAALRAEERAAGHDRQAADEPFWPRLEFEAFANREDVSRDRARAERDVGGRLLLTFNLFRGGADEARRRRAAHEAAWARWRAEELALNTSERVRAAFVDLNTLRMRRPALESRVQASQDVVRTYGRQFEIGQRTLLDLLDAHNELFTAELQHVGALHDERLAEYRILAEMGDLGEAFATAG